jgi:hypothetical protein
MKIEEKIPIEEIVTRIKKHSRQIIIPKNRIICSKKQKQKDDRRSWKRDLQIKVTIPVNYIYRKMINN